MGFGTLGVLRLTRAMLNLNACIDHLDLIITTSLSLPLSLSLDELLNFEHIRSIFTTNLLLRWSKWMELDIYIKLDIHSCEETLHGIIACMSAWHDIIVNVGELLILEFILQSEQYSLTMSTDLVKTIGDVYALVFLRTNDMQFLYSFVFVIWRHSSSLSLSPKHVVHRLLLIAFVCSA